MDYVNGVDVSDWNPVSDWKRVKAAGYSWAIAKATEGTKNVQSTFASNYAGIRTAGMVAGAYHFFDWDADPIDQAEHFLSVYTPRTGDLPPTIDCEGTPPAAEEATHLVSVFIDEIEKQLHGAKAIIYCSYAFVDEAFPGSPFAGHPLWVAAYNSDPEPPVPDDWHPRIWQYSSTGRVSGISGNVDLDRFVGTLSDLHGFALK